jgi:hypothetical protein|nr:MAG TPA: hypothetical protein [Caudoviricetes sp.]
MINLTPHDIRIVVNGNTLTFPKTGTVARVSVTTQVIGEELGIPVVVTNYGNVENVPVAGTEKFLVSAMVLARLGKEYQGWAFAPDTGATAIRNDKGQIEAVTRLVTVE